MPRVLEKVERRLGEKLMLKGIRCAGPKCAQTRRSYAPGPRGKGQGRKRGLSEYGTLFREKQKIRYMYGLDDREIERYSKRVASKPGLFSSNFLQLLESRLDNAFFRMGFAESRRIARQIINHGHVLVNGKTVSIPSYRIKKGDAVSIKERILSSPLFAELETRLKKYGPPRWIELDAAKKTGTVLRLPGLDDAGVTVDVTKIKEFYSR